MNIGIIGKGFVGNAIAESYKGHHVAFYDPFKPGSVESIGDLCHCITIFICVPTPKAMDGRCDTSIVESTLQTLVNYQYKGLVIAKSTAPFEIYERFSEKLKLAFIPEFLRGAHAVDDYLNSEFMIVGSNSWSVHASVVEILYNSDLHKLSTFRRLSIREACLVKYFENSFLATKVSLMNEFYFLAKALGVNWENTIEALALDPRIGQDHTRVPGPDGIYGWGGHCLPKDTEALINIAKDAGIRLPVLEEAVRTNKLTRRFHGGTDV